MALADILRLLMAQPQSAPVGGPQMLPLPKAASSVSAPSVPSANVPGPYEGLNAMSNFASAAGLNQYRDAQTALLKRQLEMQQGVYNNINDWLKGGGVGPAPTSVASSPQGEPPSPPASGMRTGGALDFPALRSLAEQAGFKGDKADIMAATSLAESGGNPFAIGDKDIGGSFGITQINQKAHGPIAQEAYGNPERAMQLAFGISKGGEDFSPWTMYKNGGYRKYLPSSQGMGSGLAAADQGGAPPPGGDMVRMRDAGGEYMIPADQVRNQIANGPTGTEMVGRAASSAAMAAPSISPPPVPQNMGTGIPSQLNLTPAQRQIVALGMMGRVSGLGDIAAPLAQAYYGSPEYLTAKSAAEARGQYAGPGADVALQGQLAGAKANAEQEASARFAEKIAAGRARGEYAGPGADVGLQGKLAGAKASAEQQAKYLGPEANVGLQGELAGSKAAAEQAARVKFAEQLAALEQRGKESQTFHTLSPGQVAGTGTNFGIANPVMVEGSTPTGAPTRQFITPPLPGGAGMPAQPGAADTGGAGAPIQTGTSPAFIHGMQGQMDADLERINKVLRPQADKASGMMATAQLIKDTLPDVTLGKWAEQKQALGRILLGLHVSPDWVTQNITNVAQGDIIQKNFLQQSAAAVREMGAREPGSVIALFRNAYPNLETQPGAVQLMQNVLFMQAKREQDLVGAAQAAHSGGVAGLSQGQPYKPIAEVEHQFDKGPYSTINYLRAAEAMAGGEIASATGKADLPRGLHGVSPQDFEQIYGLMPSGQVFIGPDGAVRRKP